MIAKYFKKGKIKFYWPFFWSRALVFLDSFEGAFQFAHRYLLDEILCSFMIDKSRKHTCHFDNLSKSSFLWCFVEPIEMRGTESGQMIQ